MEEFFETVGDGASRDSDAGVALRTTKKKKKKKEKNGGGGSKGVAHAEQKRILARLTRPPKKNYHVEDLSVATLRPLVDLAYWSTFREVRKDCAAALTTLAMNEQNLPVLSEAGALGAVLALIGMNDGMNDAMIQRDAALALSCLLKLNDVLKRFIKAPDGLRSVFYLCRSPSVEVKRACVRIFAELARSAETKEALVESGGVKYLFGLAQTNDDSTIRKAAQVLKKLAQHPANQARFCHDDQSIRSTITLLIEARDLQIRRDTMEIILAISSTDDHRQRLVEHGILTPLLMHVDPQTSSLETISLVLRCILSLSNCTEVLEMAVEEGVVDAVSRIIFEELGEIRAYRASRAKELGSLNKRFTEAKLDIDDSSPGPASATAGGALIGGDPTARKGDKRRSKFRAKTMAEMENETLRFGLGILVNLASEPKTQQTVVDKEIAKALLEDQILESDDKRVPRLVAKLLVKLAEKHDRKRLEASQLHEALIQHGILHPIRLFLKSRDFNLRTFALSIAANLTESDCAKLEFGRHPEILRRSITLCNVFDEEVNVEIGKLVANMSDHKPNFGPLLKANALDAVLFMISPRSKNKVAECEAARALANLAADPDVRNELVQSGALGHLISLSKSGTGLTKMYAIAALTALEHDTAAVRIQTVFRGFITRKNAGRWAMDDAIREEKDEDALSDNEHKQVG